MEKNSEFKIFISQIISFYYAFLIAKSFYGFGYE